MQEKVATAKHDMEQSYQQLLLSIAATAESARVSLKKDVIETGQQHQRTIADLETRVGDLTADINALRTAQSRQLDELSRRVDVQQELHQHAAAAAREHVATNLRTNDDRLQQLPLQVRARKGKKRRKRRRERKRNKKRYDNRSHWF